MVVKLNTVRLNGASLNHASLNGAGERLRASAGGGGGEVIPPEEPDVPVTYILSASASNGVVSASVNGNAVTLPYTANEGDVVVVEVTANDGYVFEGWSDGSTDNPRSITMTADVTLSATCVVKAVEKEYIQFADPAVEAVLMSKGVSSDGVGITMEDAAAVTTIGGWFRSNTEITSFDEFEYFTGVTFLGTSTNQTNGGAFNGCTSLQSIKLPSSVTHLRPGAFYNCTSLRNVGDLSNVKQIDIYAFSGTLLEGEINLASVEGEIGYKSFAKTNITKILSLGNATIIGSSTQSTTGAFAECGLLQSVELPSTLTEIRNYAFYKCASLETVICRASTPPTLGTNVFYGSTCPIYVPDASLEAYKTATNWSSYADRIHPLSEIEGSPYITFADAEVERVLMANGVSSDGVGITMADAEAVTSIGTWFKGNTAIQSFDEFQYFTGVTALGVKYNYDGSKAAFSGCTNLASVVLPVSIKVIGNSAFKGCSSLQNINIPSTITELDASAFEGCAFELNDLYLPNLTFFNVKVFHGGPKIRRISNLGSITSLPDAGWGANANYGDKSFLEEITLPATMTNIVQASFYNYVALHTVVCLAETPPSLANTNVFDGCPLDNGIYVPDASVDAYKTATNWSTYASRIKPLSLFGLPEPEYENVTGNYSLEIGQAYGQAGNNIQFTTDTAYEHTKVAIGDVDYVRVKAPSQASSLVQYVDGNNKILKIAVTHFPSAMTRYDIEGVDGATHIYVTSATGTLEIWKAVES